MSDIGRVSPETAREDVQSGKALLVCAYDDDGKYGRMRLEGSIALSKFKSGISGIAKDSEIIFY
ncbi:MAG: hypothetical protein AMK71_07970 [Nitrospira bacterium SG8_35_4]|nr:MAG: hypothetical protein AMK71_07970 [Nitrospira bacterium SG8_35_4]